MVLLTECKNLLSACDDLVVAKEEILRLYDLSTNSDTSMTLTAQCKDEHGSI